MNKVFPWIRIVSLMMILPDLKYISILGIL